MPARTLASNEEIIEAYKATGSVWKAAKTLGLCGQSVWERLKRLKYDLPGTNWTDEEHAELRSLAGQCTLAEIAKRIGRPYGSVADKMSALGLTNLVRASNKKVSLRGTGLTAETIKKHIQELEAFKGTLGQFCRQRGFSIDVFVKAVQKYQPDFWTEYSRERAVTGAQKCEYCEQDFYPMNKKQKTCSRKCQATARVNRQYFNGQRQFTIGMAEGICQICLRERKRLSSHHVWGKENDQEAKFLIAVCQGCHHLISQLSSSKLSQDSGFYERLIIYANLRRFGDQKPFGFHCYVEVEPMTEEEIEDGAW